MRKITIEVEPDVLMAVLREAGPKSLEARIVYAEMLRAMSAETLEYLETLLAVRQAHAHNATTECACQFCRCAAPFVHGETKEVSA